MSLAYATPEIPGIGGVIKQRPDDFLVEELPLYEPSGQGEHLMLLIEKRHMTTTDVVRRLAKLFHVRRSDIGYAGLKDKYAITRQHFTVRLPGASQDEQFLERFNYVPFGLLWARRHTNKLQRGHLKGNRFVIRIRQAEPTKAPAVRHALERLVQIGVPNYFGVQRFGYRNNTHVLGRLLLTRKWQELLDELLGRPYAWESPDVRAGREAYDRRDYASALAIWPRQLRFDRQALDALRQGKSAQEAVLAIDAQQRLFLLSAFQSAIFNRVLDRRLRQASASTPESNGAPGIDRLIEGDLAWKHDSRAVFLVDAATADVENAADGRVRRLAVSPSGPIWGPDMIRPTGVVAQWEMQALTDEGLSEADVIDPNVETSGMRRSLREILTDPEVTAGADDFGPYLQVSFVLPRGSFATVVLREIMKNDAAEQEQDGAENGGNP